MKNHITLKQKIVEILAYVLMWASIVIGIIWSAKLPKEVATHFDAAGNADGYGSPYSFLFLPIIMLITCGIAFCLIFSTNGLAAIFDVPCSRYPA